MITRDSTIAGCSLFFNLEQETIEDVISQSETKNYAAGDVLIRKGDLTDTLFIISSGKVGIYNEDILLAELGDLSVMGESFLDTENSTATATIVALTQLVTLEINKDTFYNLTLKHPKLMFNLFSINFQRIRLSNEAALTEARAREGNLKQLVTARTKELYSALEELQTTNKELSDTRDHLIQTQKFRDQFLANMSHEIRTPMNAIIGLTNLLVKSPLNDVQQKYLNVIRKSGSNLLVIINDILDLAKIESGKSVLEAVPFSLHGVVESVYTILSLKAEEKEIYLKESVAEDVPEYVIGDETRITQVLMNLVSNAIKFTDKGRVTISVTAKKTSGNNFDVTFNIKDTGIGIHEDKLDKIFESFIQASSDWKKKFGGTGLGLTISRQLVEMHGSELNVKSIHGEGSEFFFTISYKATSKPDETVPDGSEANRDMKGKRILLVEDNEFNQIVAVDTLQDIFPGIIVDISENGKDAIEKVSANDYSFVFMDIQLPDMDGFEVTKYIRENLDATKKKIRICAMTASVTKKRILECYDMGMNDYLMKPFTPEMLKEKVIRNVLMSDEINHTNRYPNTKAFILDKLKNELPANLHYHNYHHTLDVLEAAEMIGEREKLSDKEMELLRVAVLFHDAGFGVDPKKHEEVGCKMVKEFLPGFGYSGQEIDTICGIIMATQYPQRPNNLLEQVICDADLDYLGRDDFFTIGNSLFRELKNKGTIVNEKEWNELQEKFLVSHKYFTNTSLKLRDPKKKENLEKIRGLLK